MEEGDTWEQDGSDDKDFVDEVSEAAEYSPKSDFSKAQITYEQAQRCCLYRSEEMRSGYSTHQVDKMGNMKLVHITDARKKFIGSVDALMNLLSPEIKRKRDKEYLNEFREAKNTIKKKYVYKEKEVKSLNGRYKLLPTGREYIPEVGDIVVSGIKATGKGTMGEMKLEGYWDSKVNAYYNDLLELYDILFSDLSCLIDELNYFKQSLNF